MNALFDSSAKWIKAPESFESAVPLFEKCFVSEQPVFSATLTVTAHGVYSASINGKPVSDYVFAPGWTAFDRRLQYQTYDVTALLARDNHIEISVGDGWMYRHYERWPGNSCLRIRLLAVLEIVYADGSTKTFPTGSDWSVRECRIRTSNIYKGETIDDTFVPPAAVPAIETEDDKSVLIPQEGEKILEVMALPAIELIRTPKGETVIDFGQNVTGYVEFLADAPRGTELVLHHAEILDCEGNFYTDNYRAAVSEIRYICGDQPCRVKPTHSFQGFRYIRLTGFPKVRLADFRAIAVSSDMKRTGWFSCSDGMVNQLFENIIWGQRDNFLDVPTDCPQRDERLGWTGDAQVFAEVASYNFDTRRFYEKWLNDMAADQTEDGLIPRIIPNVWDPGTSAGWGDAAAIVPWQVYLTYGDKEALQRHFPCMKKWVDFITSTSTDGIWDKNKDHYGDWLGLDAEPDSYTGATDKILIATAYYAYSTEILVKAGIALNKDMTDYKLLLQRIREAFRAKYIRDGRLLCETQTACVLTLQFGLCAKEDAVSVTQQLAALVRGCGHLTTGFLGTPYLLHVLSDNGETELAYELLLRREYPGWLYPITKGATTMWEHWDGIKPDGSLWSDKMNSFNHYAYGAVGDWLYGVVCGIRRDEKNPGFAAIRFEPKPSARLQWAKAEIDTVHGKVFSGWERKDGGVLHTFTVPAGCQAVAVIDGTPIKLREGTQTVFDDETR